LQHLRYRRSMQASLQVHPVARRCSLATTLHSVNVMSYPRPSASAVLHELSVTPQEAVWRRGLDVPTQAHDYWNLVAR
jgi:hypothetical protein